MHTRVFLKGMYVQAYVWACAFVMFACVWIGFVLACESKRLCARVCLCERLCVETHVCG